MKSSSEIERVVIGIKRVVIKAKRVLAFRETQNWICDGLILKLSCGGWLLRDVFKLVNDNVNKTT